jgi:hypothetical protein
LLKLLHLLQRIPAPSQRTHQKTNDQAVHLDATDASPNLLLSSDSDDSITDVNDADTQKVVIANSAVTRAPTKDPGTKPSPTTKNTQAVTNAAKVVSTKPAPTDKKTNPQAVTSAARVSGSNPASTDKKTNDQAVHLDATDASPNLLLSSDSDDSITDVNDADTQKVVIANSAVTRAPTKDPGTKPSPTTKNTQAVTNAAKVVSTKPVPTDKKTNPQAVTSAARVSGSNPAPTDKKTNDQAVHLDATDASPNLLLSSDSDDSITDVNDADTQKVVIANSAVTRAPAQGSGTKPAPTDKKIKAQAVTSAAPNGDDSDDNVIIIDNTDTKSMSAVPGNTKDGGDKPQKATATLEARQDTARADSNDAKRKGKRPSVNNRPIKRQRRHDYDTDESSDDRYSIRGYQWKYGHSDDDDENPPAKRTKTNAARTHKDSSTNRSSRVGVPATIHARANPAPGPAPAAATQPGGPAAPTSSWVRTNLASRGFRRRRKITSSNKSNR